MAIAKRTAWEQWSGGDLHTAGGPAKIFRVTKQMRRDRRDVKGTNLIKGEDGVIKVDGAEVWKRWRGYFQELLNGENECEFGKEGAVEGPLNIITWKEVEGALRGIKNSKAAGPSGMTSNLLKFAGAMGVRELLRVFQGIMGVEHAPDEWRNSLPIPLYKGKGDALQCGK